jgi:hypothetical protein
MAANAGVFCKRAAREQEQSNREKHGLRCANEGNAGHARQNWGNYPFNGSCEVVDEMLQSIKGFSFYYKAGRSKNTIKIKKIRKRPEVE